MAPKPFLQHAKDDDDILSYLFVDLGLFRKFHDKERRITRKFNREDFRPKPSAHWDAYLDIIRQVKTGKLTTQQGFNKLLAKGNLQSHLAKKRGSEQWNHFVTHVERYLELCRPDSPFKLFLVNRFKQPAPGSKGKGKAQATETTPVPEIKSEVPVATGEAAPAEDTTPAVPASTDASDAPSTSQAGSRPSTPTKTETMFGASLDLGVKSLRAYKIHEKLRLFGSGVSLSTEEHDAMLNDEGLLDVDFSVLFSSSKKCYQLFLGPGRFVNHDCNPNVDLIRSGPRLCFKAIRPIEANDELLTYYGDHYFGRNNEHCLCLTCKKNRKGAYSKPEKPSKVSSPADPQARQTRSGQQPPKPVSLRKTVHKANLARTTITITQGSRRSERTITQLASTSSLENAKEAIRRDAKGGSGRKRKRNESEDEDEDDDDEDDRNYSSKKRIRAKTSRASGKKRSGHGSDSSLTDVDDLAYTMTTECTTVEIAASQIEPSAAAQTFKNEEADTFAITNDNTREGSLYAESLVATESQTEETAPTPVTATSQDLRSQSPTPASSDQGLAKDAEVPTSDHESPVAAKPDATCYQGGSHQPSDAPARELEHLCTSTKDLAAKMTALAGQAKAALCYPFTSAPVASDTASVASQSSVFDMEDGRNVCT